MARDESVHGMHLSERMECPKGAGLVVKYVYRKRIEETQGCRMRMLRTYCMKMIVK